LKRVNNQIKNIKKKQSMAKRKNKFEKKKGLYQILPDRSGQPIFAGFLLVLVFHLIPELVQPTG